MNDLDLEVGFNLNEEETENSARAIRQSINSVGDAARTQGAVAARSFNGLQNSINQLSRELPSFTYSAQTGFLAISNNIPILVDEINRLRAANVALSASGQTTVPVWRQVVSGFFSWGTALSVGITLLTVYGKEIGNFISSLFKGKDALEAAKQSLQSLNEVVKDANKEAGKELTVLNVLYKAATDVTNSTKARTAAAQELKKEFPDAFANSKTQAIMNGEEKKSFDELTKSILDNAKARAAASKIEQLAAQQLDIDFEKQKIINVKNAEIARVKPVDQFAQNPNVDAPSRPLTEQEKAQSVIDQQNVLRQGLATELKQKDDQRKLLQDQIDFLTAFAGGTNKIAAAMSKGTYDAAKNAARAFAEIISSRKEVMNQLNDLEAEYSRKSFDSNDEELQALKDKFDKFRRTITTENDKIAEYNKTHDKQAALIDVTQVDPIEQRATADLKYRQDTERLKTTLEEQKKLYADFENYKTLYGQTKAVERYKNEVDTSKTYLQVIADEYANLLALQAVAPLTGGQQERLKLLADAFKQEQQLTQTNSVKMLADLQSFQEKRVALQENALAKIQKLQADGNTKEADALRVKSEAELTEFDKSHVEQLDSYKALFENVDHMTTGALQKSLTNLRTEVNKLSLTPKAKEFFDKVFTDMQARIDGKEADNFKNIASALNDASRYASTFSAGLSSALQTAANLADQVATIKQSIANFKLSSGNGDVFGQISAGLGVFGAVMGVFSGIASLFDHSAEIEKEREESLQRQVQLIESVNTRMREQIELNQKLLGDDRVKGYAQSMADIAVKIDEQNQKLREQFRLTHNSSIDQHVQNNDSSFIGSDELNQLKQQLSLAELSEDQIKALYDNGDLDDRAKAAYDSLIDLRQQQEDLLNEMNKELTGVDFDTLLDNFASIFDKAEPTVEDFAQFFQNTMQEAARNAFKREVLEQSLQDWYNEFTELSKDGLTAAEKDQLQADYNRRVAEIQQKAKDLEAATGISLGNPDDDTANSDANSLKGAYKTASQASIDLLSANTGGLRIAAVEGNNLLKVNNATMADGLSEIKKQTLSLMEISVNTKVTADYAPYLKNLEDINKKMDNNGNYLQGTGRGG